MSELKPCPFCGGESSIHRDYCSDGFGTFISVKCNNCGAKSSDKYASKGNECPMFYQEVRDIWNTRPTEERLTAQLEVAKKALDKTLCELSMHFNEDWIDCPKGGKVFLQSRIRRTGNSIIKAKATASKALTEINNMENE